MEWTELIGFALTAVIAVFGSYTATKRINEERELRLETKIARLEAKMDSLTSEVEKHNQMVERTYKLETEVDNLYHRYDELKGAAK